MTPQGNSKNSNNEAINPTKLECKCGPILKLHNGARKTGMGDRTAYELQRINAALIRNGYTYSEAQKTESDQAKDYVGSEAGSYT